MIGLIARSMITSKKEPLQAALFLNMLLRSYLEMTLTFSLTIAAF